MGGEPSPYGMDPCEEKSAARAREGGETVAGDSPQERKPSEDAPRPDFRTFVLIPDEILCRRELTGGVKCIYAHLLRRAGRNPTAYPSLADIARNTGVGVRQARRGVRELERSGLIRVEDKRGGWRRSNTYRLLWDSPWWSETQTQAVGFSSIEPSEDCAETRTRMVREPGHRRSETRTQTVAKEKKKRSKGKELRAHKSRSHADLDFAPANAGTPQAVRVRPAPSDDELQGRMPAIAAAESLVQRARLSALAPAGPPVRDSRSPQGPLAGHVRQTRPTRAGTSPRNGRTSDRTTAKSVLSDPPFQHEFSAT